MISSLTVPGYKGYDDFSNSPGNIIVSVATYHDDRVFLWNPTCVPSIMFQIKRLSTWEER